MERIPAAPMRPGITLLGGVLLLMGIVWALQGAYLVPATFMRGPLWILLGSGLAASGGMVCLLGSGTRP